MTEEIKKENAGEKRCGCVSHDCKIFLLTILASFLGCLVALCLFTAAVKPQHKPCPCLLKHQHRMEAPVPFGFEADQLRKGDFRPDGGNFRPEGPKGHPQALGQKDFRAPQKDAPVKEAPKVPKA